MFGVALIDCKNAWNLGNALRSTVAFGGSMFIVQGTRWAGTGDWTKTDTENARDRIPMHLGVKNALDHIPTNCKSRIVAVEMVPNAIPISNYKHSENEFFLFGPEDGRLSDSILESCSETIYLPTAYSLNLASCVACIGHNRMIQKANEPKDKIHCPNCGHDKIKLVWDSSSHLHCNACGHEWSMSL
jgi:tRNA(Leu) C34 or U34 (ribose-2'-O)-methylase TrmL